MTEPSGIDALPRAQPATSRLLITLVLDTSGSMAHANRIGELNAALQSWRAELTGNAHVNRHGEIAIVTFGRNGVELVDPSGRALGRPDEPYVPVSQFNPPALVADGVTPMVEGLQYAFDVLAERRQHLRSTGHPLVNRSLVYLITDGVPTDSAGQVSDSWRDFAPVIRQQEAGKHLLFFAFGVDGADQEVLRGLAPQSWHFLASSPFAQVLRMVSTSIEAATAAANANATAAETYGQVRAQQDKLTRMREFLEGNG